MGKPIQVVTRRFTEEVEQRIARDYLPRFNRSDEPFTQDELLEAAEGADALFVSPVDRLDARFFRRVPISVKVIATFSVGYDHIDLKAAAGRGIAIAHTPDVLTEATADIALLLLLGASRRAYEGQKLVRSGQWKYRRPPTCLAGNWAAKCWAFSEWDALARQWLHGPAHSV